MGTSRNAGLIIIGANPAAVDNDSTTAIRGYHEVLAVAPARGRAACCSMTDRPPP